MTVAVADSPFSPDYQTARARFREAAGALGGVLESFPVGPKGQGGDDLTIDAARWGDPEADRLLVVSSGLHGVEGFFGSAAQLAWMAGGLGGGPPGPGEAVLLLHALDPYGFDRLRRFDEANIDLNRNFLLDGEAFEGSPPGYRELDGLINPKRGGGRIDRLIYHARALAVIKRLGLPAVKQAVAGGQYDAPLGLFFGGKGPAGVRLILEAQLPRWVGPATVVRHIDFHTGLGGWGTYKLLVYHGTPSERIDRFREVHGVESVDTGDPKGVAYEARGDIGRWLLHRLADRDCLSACAEFGTYAPLEVLGALRDENRAHHWRPEGHPDRLIAGRRLAETFCPASEAWRASVTAGAVELLDRTRRATFRGGPGSG